MAGFPTATCWTRGAIALGFPETVAAIKKMTLKRPKTSVKLAEDNANGPAVISALRHEIACLIAITPEGGKVAHAQAVSPQVESCSVYLPHSAIAPGWSPSSTSAAVSRTESMTDQVDQMTQVLNRLRGATSPAKKPAYRPPPQSSGELSWMRQSLGIDQPYTGPTARKREIARDRVNPAELLLLRTPDEDRWQGHRR